MIPDNTPWQPVVPAQLSWGEDGTPFSTQFQDVYYNHIDGLAESQYVFLAGSNLPQRWHSHAERTFCIAETGFGAGLNFLATWQAWDALPEPKPDLHYLAIEHAPLTAQDLARALNQWPVLATFANQLTAAYPGLIPGEHRLVFAGGRIRLDLWWHDAIASLTDLVERAAHVVDAWYLDGFTPSRNARMWLPALFDAAAALSRPKATLASFTAAGDVRRALADAGFTINKRTGYERKRECISGVISDKPHDNSERFSASTPWDLPKQRASRPGSALVIGAGLAGATTAAALAKRGIDVTVVEAGEVASGASANTQGVLYTRLSVAHSNLVDFAIGSFTYASRFYRALFDRQILHSPRDGELCGCFAQINKPLKRKALLSLEKMQRVLEHVPELAQVLSAADATTQLGSSVAHAGYWYPGSGWLNPAAVCHALLQHSAIRLLDNTGAVTLERNGNRWQATSASGALATADIAILATGTSTDQFDDLSWLPLQSVRGQTTNIPATPLSKQLKAVLCHEGYIAPARDNLHCIGASFGPGDLGRSERASEHAGNIDALSRALPSLAAELQGLNSEQLSGKVRFRCASNDYLPIVGQVPDRDALCATYAPLRKDAKEVITERGDYIAGLYVNTAHGSRGLTSTPLAAECLASDICHEPPPFSRKFGRALSPTRFIIRDLNRNKP